ncbi:hypothetical protein SAMN05216559_1864 [Halomicrobium zhouii]|uniref:Uncharacterized protein n=1 Tax=Halomicrobium zhouii TaxID=767519 RepID=A0A1I6L221_9EURY|nr:hypothetical protein [Halomicrobium zhouii]SFR97505.1 hypothetical protein SAMN05216559_1864 [Halomicrobium zhouii]
MGTAYLLLPDICDTTVDNECFVWSPFNTNTPPIYEARFTASQSTEGQLVTSVDGIKAKQFLMHLDEAHPWTKVFSTGSDERSIAKLVEIFVAIGRVVVRDDDLVVVFEAQPA